MQSLRLHHRSLAKRRVDARLPLRLVIAGQARNDRAKCALFVYDFLSIHPFQDGNGILSRLLATLLLLKINNKWIEYVSFENEVEHRKTEYYRVLRRCQVNRPGEDVTTWIEFFFDALGNIQDLLTGKLHMQGALASLSPR